MRVAQKFSTPRTNQVLEYVYPGTNTATSMSITTDILVNIGKFNNPGDTDPTTDEKVLRDWTAKGIGYWSQTTSTHVNLARRFADKVCNET